MTSKPSKNVSVIVEPCDYASTDKDTVITMITGRLSSVRKKMRMIASATKLQQQQQQQDLVRRRSGDVTPRSVPSHAS